MNSNQWKVTVTDMATLKTVVEEWCADEEQARVAFADQQNEYLETCRYSIQSNPAEPNVALAHRHRSDESFLIELLPPTPTYNFDPLFFAVKLFAGLEHLRQQQQRHYTVDISSPGDKSVTRLQPATTRAAALERVEQIIADVKAQGRARHPGQRVFGQVAAGRAAPGRAAGAGSRGAAVNPVRFIQC